MSGVSMRQMLEAGVHFGHQTRFWNPKMAPFIFGERNKIHIINLEKTQPMYAEAANFVQERGRGRRQGAVRRHQALGARGRARRKPQRCEMPYVNQRWLGGMLTNFKTIRGSIKRLMDLTEMSENGTLGKRGKKEATMMRREKDKLEKSLGGIKQMEAPPDVIFIVDVGHEEIAILEAKKLGIPVVAVVDTNCAPDNVDYVIPGNDDAMRAIALYATGIADAVIEGKSQVPAVVVGEDEFVELDESGNPKKKGARGRAPPKAAGAGAQPPSGEHRARAVARWSRASRPSRKTASIRPCSTDTGEARAAQRHGQRRPLAHRHGQCPDRASRWWWRRRPRRG